MVSCGRRQHSTSLHNALHLLVMPPPRHLHAPLFHSSPSSATPCAQRLPHPAVPCMNPPSERRSTHIRLRLRRRTKPLPLVLLRGHHRRATNMLGQSLHPIRAPALSFLQDWLPQNNSLPSMSANTAAKGLLARAASRYVSCRSSCVNEKRIEPHLLFQIHVHSHTGERRKYQFICTVPAIITSVADTATPQRSNAPLRDATARSACRATCDATHALICSRETRLARAKATKRARRDPRSHRQSNRSRCRLLDEPWLRPANPAGEGEDHHDDSGLLYSARSFQDWAGLECFDYGIIMFSSLFACNAQHGKLIYSIGTPIVTSASLFIRLTYSLAATRDGG
jgi:hypothetical protein